MAVLDTHILVWWFDERPRLSRRVRELLDRAGPERPLRVSAISLWEISNLYSFGRLDLKRPLRDWLEMATASPKVDVASITPAVAAAVATLPEAFHRDPADRIIVATSLVLGEPLVTVDRRIVESGIVPVIA
jgi:PIN domain nuclease of toxin-antitoxin system